MPAPAAPCRLRCEYLEKPLGLDVTQPRLSWWVRDDRRGAMQAAYQVRVASEPQRLAEDQADLWDSGRVDSEASSQVAYAGRKLRSGQRCWWQVRTWDRDGGVSPWSEPAHWQMGLLEAGDWHAAWIGSPLVGSPVTPVPCPLLRRSFRVDRPIAHASLHITALGLYECWVNGQRVSNDVFRPGWTDYRKRVPVQTYDVTALLKRGDNAIGAMLGDGWYCGNVCWVGRQFYGDRPRLLAQLEITTDDGQVQRLVTDHQWRWRPGPVVAADLLMGESHDARLEVADWSEAGLDDAAWNPVETFDDPGIARVWSAAPPVRAVLELRPVDEPRRGPRSFAGRTWIFDLGQNIAGRVRLRARSQAGRTVRLRFAEMLNSDGSLYTENLRRAAATDHYTFAGDEEETWEPRFTFHGFRYVELAGLDEASRDTITGIVLQSDTPATGSFTCSDPLINQLQSNITWGQRGNFLEVPTDCPQRDERLGWTGDAQVFVRTACFNMDVAGFFTKWAQDLRDAQPDSGTYTPVAPHVGTQPEGGPAWAEAGVICPWTVYRCYGDTRILEQHYPSMVRFVEYLHRTSRDGIRPFEGYEGWHGYGDWLATDAPNPGTAPTPKALIGTAYFAHAADLLARSAATLGRGDDAERFRGLFDEVRAAFEHHFVTASGHVVGHTQTGYLLALAFDLLPEARRPAALEHLIATLRARQWHLSTGFVGTPLLCPVLSRFGRTDIAYRILQQRTYPGWLYSILQGATTMWERWNSYSHDKGFGDAGMNSFNHYAYGSIGQWLYETVAGLGMDEAQDSVGYRRLHIAPQPGGGLTHAAATIDTMQGPASSAWRIDGDRLTLDISVPANSAALVVLPGPLIDCDAPTPPVDGTYTLGAGQYRFVCRWTAPQPGTGDPRP